MSDTLYAATHRATGEFFNIKNLSVSDISPLGQMIGAATKTLKVSAETASQDAPGLTEILLPLIELMGQGVEAAETAESFYEWSTLFGEAIIEIEKTRNGPIDESSFALMPLAPMTFLHKIISNAAMLGIQESDWRSWQLPVILNADSILLEPWYSSWGWVPDTRTGCPPCTTECPHLGQNLNVWGRWNNPRGCGIVLKKKLDLKYKGVGFSFYVWHQTCTWDVSYEHVQTSACYKSRVSKYLTGWGSCCSSQYLWHTVKKGVRRKFEITTSSSAVPTFPNSQKTLELGKPINPPPNKAKRVRWAR